MVKIFAELVIFIKKPYYIVLLYFKPYGCILRLGYLDFAGDQGNMRKFLSYIFDCLRRKFTPGYGKVVQAFKVCQHRPFSINIQSGIVKVYIGQSLQLFETSKAAFPSGSLLG